MVTPLKTWQHQEPKGLWPALGGLALLTHVGVLGLSLPYVLEMMQPGGAGTKSTIPIELIVVDPASRSAEASTEAENSSPELAEPAPEPPPPETSPPARPPRVQTAEPAVSSSSDSVLTSPADPVPVVPEEPVLPEEPVSDDEAIAEKDEDSSETPNAGSPNPGTTEGEDSDENAEETGETGPTTLPSGGPALPEPGGAGEGGDHNQVASIKLNGHSYVPEELRTDLADMPATPIYEAVNAIELDAQNVGCGRVDFSQRLVTYRVEISPEGTLRSASPWTGSIAPYNMSEQEKTISCLIVAAGFRFNPATQQGEPVANSDLLLTIESGTN